MDLHSTVVYRVETRRLALRCWSPDDARLVRAAIDRSDQHLRPWVPFMKDEPRSLKQTGRWLRELRAAFDRSENFRFAVFDAEADVLVGENMLLSRVGPGALEIGYLTHLGFEGHGYASEASCVMVRLAFELYGASRLEVHHAQKNTASAAIPTRLGFQHEATLKDRIVDTEGQLHDLVLWTMFASDYASSPARKLAGELDMVAFDELGEVIRLA